MVKTNKTVVAAALAAGFIVFGLSGCSSKADKSDKGDTKAAASSSASSSAPSMSAADLQTSLAGKISTATPASAVTCAGDLPGEVGKTTTCEVAVNDSVSVQANVVVTKVNGSTINYDFTPAMTQAQLEKAFSAKAAAQVTCDGGLDGKVGSSTKCQITKDGTTDATTVSVSKVQGLYMSLATSPA